MTQTEPVAQAPLGSCFQHYWDSALPQERVRTRERLIGLSVWVGYPFPGSPQAWVTQVSLDFPFTLGLSLEPLGSLSSLDTVPGASVCPKPKFTLGVSLRCSAPPPERLRSSERRHLAGMACFLTL